jgi:hypothetical protein
MVPVILTSPREAVIFGVFAGWGLVFAVIAWVSWLTKCPSCGRQFHVSDTFVSNPWTRRCMKCGYEL